MTFISCGFSCLRQTKNHRGRSHFKESCDFSGPPSSDGDVVPHGLSITIDSLQIASFPSPLAHPISQEVSTLTFLISFTNQTPVRHLSVTVPVPVLTTDSVPSRQQNRGGSAVKTTGMISTTPSPDLFGSVLSCHSAPKTTVLPSGTWRAPQACHDPRSTGSIKMLSLHGRLLSLASTTGD